MKKILMDLFQDKSQRDIEWFLQKVHGDTYGYTGHSSLMRELSKTMFTEGLSLLRTKYPESTLYPNY